MNKKKITAIVMGMVMVTSSFLTGCGSKSTSSTGDGNKDKDYVVKLGYYNCDHMTAACIGKDAGIFDKLGLKVEVTGNGKVPEAMAAGKMDVGYIGSGGLIASQMKGSPIMVAANNHIGGSYYLVVKNSIKDPKDLIGKKLAIGSKPENDLSWVEMSKKLNIPVEGKNYAPVDMSGLKDKYLAFKTDKIDGYTTCDPWGSMAEYEKTGHIMATYAEPDGQWGACCFYSMNTKFAKEHPELAKKMILAHTQSMEYIYNHPVKSAKIFAKNYNVPEEVALMTIYKKTVGEGRTLTWKITPEYIKHEIKEQLKVKGIEKEPKYEDIVQDKLLKESGADDFDKFIKEKIDPVFQIGMTYEQWKNKAMEVDK